MSYLFNRTIVGLLTFFFVQTGQASFDIEDVTSPKHGIKAWCMRDETTPIVSIAFAFKGGTIATPLNQVGIYGLLSTMLSKGAGPWDENTYLDKLQLHGISLNFIIELDYFKISFTMPKEELPNAIEIFKTIMSAPHFDKAKLKETVTLFLAGYDSAKNSPGRAIGNYFNPLLYGNHPLGRIAADSQRALKRLKAKDLTQCLATHCAQDNLSIAIAGNLLPDDVGGLVDDLFGNLPKRSHIPEVEDIIPHCDGQVHFIYYKQEQSQIIFCQPGLKQLDPDKLKGSMLMSIMGSDDTSRLHRVLREEQASTYSVSCQASETIHAGLVSGALLTSTDKVDLVIETIRQQWKLLRDNGVTEQELNLATKKIIEEMPFSFVTSSSTADYLLSLQQQGYNKDYLKHSSEIIRGITVEEMNQFAKGYLQPDALTFLVVGKRKG